jgi:hypothetical protein
MGHMRSIVRSARSGVGVVCTMAVLLGPGWPAVASAQDQAVVQIGYAEPPPARYAPPPAVAYDAYDPRELPPEEAYRSPFRLHVGPAGATTGRGLGLGLGLAADFGRGSVGARLAAAWLKGEPSSSDTSPSPIGDGLSQYTGELTLDLRKRGPWHPVLGLGFGLARVTRGDGGGNLGIGTARLGLEYALAIEDADARLGCGITAVLPGPADRDVQDVKGWGMVGASIGLGF